MRMDIGSDRYSVTPLNNERMNVAIRLGAIARHLLLHCCSIRVIMQGYSPARDQM